MMNAGYQNAAIAITAGQSMQSAAALTWLDKPDAALEEIQSHGYVLTPGRYVGAEEIEDDGEPFEEKMPKLVAQLEEQFAESARLEQKIRANLEGLGYGG